MNNGIRIIKTKDSSVIPHLIPYMEKLIQKANEEYTIESFTQWFRHAINNPLVGLWIGLKKGNRFVKSDGQIIGYAIATITSNLEEDYVNITHIFSEDKSVTKELFNAIENWGRKNSLKIIAGITSRNPEAWKRAYGYKVVSYNMEKEI